MKDSLPTLAIIVSAVCVLVVLVAFGPVRQARVSHDMAAQTVAGVHVQDRAETNGRQAPSVAAVETNTRTPEPLVNVPRAAEEALKEIALLNATPEED